MSERITKRSMYSWVFYKNTKWQVGLILVSLVMVGARVFPLEMQRRIVDQAIGLGLVDKLVLYCMLYLGSVVLASALKFAINAMQAQIGQKTLIIIRSMLFEHIISLPLPFFRRTQPGLVISTLCQRAGCGGRIHRLCPCRSGGQPDAAAFLCRIHALSGTP